MFGIEVFVLWDIEILVEHEASESEQCVDVEVFRAHIGLLVDDEEPVKSAGFSEVLRVAVASDHLVAQGIFDELDIPIIYR